MATDLAATRTALLGHPGPARVRVYGARGTFNMVGFRLPSEADATRAETAMEFLRQGCARASAF